MLACVRLHFPVDARLSLIMSNAVDQHFALQWVQQHVGPFESRLLSCLLRELSGFRLRSLEAILQRLLYGANQQVIVLSYPEFRGLNIWIGAGSVLQHLVAQDGKTNPPLFRAGISSSLYLPPQYHFNDPIAEVRISSMVPIKTVGADQFTFIRTFTARLCR